MKTHADDYSCLRLKETQAQAAMQAWHCARPSSVDSAWCKRDQILKKLRVLSLVRRHRVSLDANYMTLVMNVLCLESMALVLLPGYNVLDAAKPLLVAHKRLPRPLFRLLLPTVQSLKRLSDRWWAARHRG